MPNLVDQVSTTIAREKLATPQGNIIIAISGGADSVALLMALHLLGYQQIALHANFGLRDEESDGDELFVKNLTHRLGIPLHTKQMPTISYAKERGISIEMAARELRYQWFQEYRQGTHQDTPIAVAHHQDDQIETLLLNLSKGTGIRGLSGMPYKREDGVIRPLLDCSRQQILDFLSQMGQDYRTDSSNRDVRYQRNLIRHQLIPLFSQINPAFPTAALRTIEQIADTEKFYTESINIWKERCLHKQGIHLPTLNQSPAPATLLFELLRGYGFSPETIRKIALELPRPQGGNRYYSDSYELFFHSEYIELFERGEEELNSFTLNFAVDKLCGRERLPSGILYWRIIDRPHMFEFRPERHEAIFDLDSLCQEDGRIELSVRTRKEGDTLHPHGMKGSKKLRRIFIDNKYTHRQRREALLLCTEDQPIWLIGAVSDRRFAPRAHQTTQSIIFLYHEQG